MALKLFGVTVNDAHLISMSVPDTETIVVRDLAAVCSTAEYRAISADDDSAAAQNRVISILTARGPVLPAPIGVVFRSGESVERWLELHYGALTDALTFVENRVAARVHVFRQTVDDERTDMSTIAEECLRVLRTSAVATLPLRAEKLTGVIVSAAFLVEQDKWNDFVLDVDAQSKIALGLRFDLTGPWPPYDFVQMQLQA
ncbi:MAG: Gas vesicle synthesis GvpLGvpF [Gemmatimonadetes bacterium]|nr:Gas vesicle synthesis GvpLGvpF [Gemmatimonadota bacterium]